MLPSINNRNNTPPSTDPTSSEANTNQYSANHTVAPSAQAKIVNNQFRQLSEIGKIKKEESYLNNAEFEALISKDKPNKDNLSLNKSEILPDNEKENFIRRMADFTPIQDESKFNTIEMTSTQEAFMALDALGNAYRLKINPPNRQINTFHEVISSRILHELGLPFSPLTSWVIDKNNQVWIASPIVPDAKDIGPFLIDEGIKYVESSDKEKYERLISDYKKQKANSAELRKSPVVKEVLETYKKGEFDKVSDAHHAILQPLRDSERKALNKQDKMFELLPSKFHSAVLTAAFASEVVGEWDFLNHARYNTMIVVNEDGNVNVQTVDRGVSGLVGFAGKLKSNNKNESLIPALVDDPYSGHLKDNIGSYSPNSSISDKMGDLDFTKISRSFGQIGSIPRSSSMAFVFKPIIKAERENQNYCPVEARDIAEYLKRVEPSKISKLIEHAYEEVERENLTELKDFFLMSSIETDKKSKLADMYNLRIKAIIERAERSTKN